MRIATLDLIPNTQDRLYLDECLRMFKQKTADLDLSEAQYQAFTEKVQLRMGCWNMMYWFRVDNYPALNPLNATHIE